MCNSILTLFYGEKLKDVLRLAECCLFWAKKDNPLPLATLFSNFSESKRLHSKERKQKIFAAAIELRKSFARLFDSEKRRYKVVHGSG